MDDTDARDLHDLPHREQATRGDAPSAGALTSVAFVAPWLLLAFALPTPWRWKALALLGLLAVLLYLASLLTERLARERALDPAWWGFLSVVTFGIAMLVVYRWEAGHVGHAQFFCRACARIGDAREPFCFGCGAYG